MRQLRLFREQTHEDDDDDNNTNGETVTTTDSRASLGALAVKIGLDSRQDVVLCGLNDMRVQALPRSIASS